MSFGKGFEQGQIGRVFNVFWSRAPEVGSSYEEGSVAPGPREHLRSLKKGVIRGSPSVYKATKTPVFIFLAICKIA